jgi:hypothetical protein
MKRGRGKKPDHPGYLYDFSIGKKRHKEMIFRKLDTFVETNMFSPDQFRKSSQQFERVDYSKSLLKELKDILNSRSYNSIGGPTI